MSLTADLAEQSDPTPPPDVPPGLSTAAARARLAAVGPNELAHAQRAGVLRQLAHGFTSPLILILLAASGLAASIGEVTDASIIAATILLGIALDAVQGSRSGAAVERLQQRVVPTATVRRDGAWVELPRREVVPGDVIRLTAGDVVPADARLLTTRDLHVQQAALTGESLPTEKEARAGPIDDDPRIAPEDQDGVFLGTSIVSGYGTALVVATGTSTAFGAIAARLREAPPPTEFERGLQHFGALLARTVIFLVLFLVLVNTALHRNPLESLLFAVAIAVGVVPEFMPMITSITLATGAIRMARKRVIVKHLAAIQNFGSIDVLCSDKTGTLTAGAMRVEAALDARGQPSARVLEVATVAAHAQTGIANPLDEAIKAAAAAPAGWEKIDEIPFDFERRRTSVAARRDGATALIVKGAPEAILAACTTLRAGSDVLPLSDAGRDAVTTLVGQASAGGLRTIAVATRALEAGDHYDRGDERDLTLEGWLTFADPPLADTGATAAALARDGVHLKILTGDDPAVAHHVCAQSGIDATAAMTGAELDRTSDAALGPLAERTTLFARVSPQQKLRIILALKARGHVVGYMGDGINDAPSLHAADVGISVANAVDVARDAADIILLDRGLGVLHAGIIEGRRAFGNLMKYLLMATSSNFGNMFSMAVASLVVPFLPMLPTQILLNNFLSDCAQVAIPSDRVDDAYLRTPQRWDIATVRRFMIRVGLISSVFDIVTFAVLLRIFRSTPAVFHTGWFIESALTQTLVLLIIRTTGRAFHSRPSTLLILTVSTTALVGLAIPFLPVRGVLGFVQPHAAMLGYVFAATAAYLATVEVAKRHILPRA